MEAPIQAVVFDFDYTLVDASPGIVHCFQHAFARMELPEPEPDRIRRTIGLTLPHAFRELAGRSEEAAEQRFTELYVARADEVMVEMTRVFDDVPHVLRELGERGIPTGIVSTKYRYRIERTLAKEGLAALIGTVVGGEDVMTHKPDPEGLRMALERLGVEAASCLYVGDSRVDAETARAAGARFLPVLTGVTPPGHFEHLPGLPPSRRLADLLGHLSDR